MQLNLDNGGWDGGIYTEICAILPDVSGCLGLSGLVSPKFRSHFRLYMLQNRRGYCALI
jgi:hypothetical protein